MSTLNFPMFIFSSFSPHNYSEANTLQIQFAVKMAFKCSINRDFSLTWSAAMQICLNKRQFVPYKKGSTPKGLVWGTEMAAVSWSWDNNMRWRRAKTLYYSWRKNRILTMEIYLIHFYLTSSLHVQTITASIECFHSRGQHLCKFIGTKESVCIRKEFNSQRIGLGHQHGRRFIVLGHQYGRRDVMWKHSIMINVPWKEYFRKP